MVDRRECERMVNRLECEGRVDRRGHGGRVDRRGRGGRVDRRGREGRVDRREREGRVDKESVRGSEGRGEDNFRLTLIVIGTSLNEPQTSKTALHTCVCMLACLLATIYCKF